MDHQMDDLQLTSQMVEQKLQSLNLNKSAGPPDELHARVLKE
jgi:hypothetical protein